ncbi:iron exporter MbfA [Consotaella salsifontis]|uniref:Rubrerythrin n=1 Tax=Consotaella salsifontis TaxID=1365950 RepID=A0A1T4QWR7_9HYPH|nr:ferritin family protein [Consotaella salsifontis]SKA07901.1 Rubrerythrin [Consotaella salsifontis]
MFRQFFSGIGKRRFEDLSEKEILALAISRMDEDSRIYATYAERLRAEFPSTAAVFEGMAVEEGAHCRRLTDAYQARFGAFILPISSHHVAGFYERRPVWLVENLGLDRIRAECMDMARTSRDFFVQAADRAFDEDVKALLAGLAEDESGHYERAEELAQRHLVGEKREEEDEAAHRRLILTWVQPGLAGLMDGSVSTLAPIFATAFATQDPKTTFLVGLSSSVGAGISMGFTEAAHDDGKLSGRGSPVKRGIACGAMTTLGGLGHALPYLIPAFWPATMIAFAIVFVELWAIVWIQNHYMRTPFLRAAFQVVLGGILVLLAGVLIGGS